jgi:ribose transport system substrate-binding protein
MPSWQSADSKELVISFGDNFEPQMPLLKTGYSHDNIGQRPHEMSYKAVEILDSFLKDGKTPADPIVTGLEVCTPDMAGKCGK